MFAQVSGGRRERVLAGIDDDQLLARLRPAIARKPERHEFRGRPEQVIRITSRAGG